MHNFYGTLSDRGGAAAPTSIWDAKTFWEHALQHDFLFPIWFFFAFFLVHSVKWKTPQGVGSWRIQGESLTQQQSDD